MTRPVGDPIESQLRTYYETEAARQLRPDPDPRRRRLREEFAAEVASSGRRSVLDVGAGPAVDHEPFVAAGVRYVGVDLAVGNGVLAAAAGQIVVPGSLYALPFRSSAFTACWSMSTYQHVPDDRIDDALAEMVRVLAPGALVAVGLWGGRDEVIESTASTTGLTLPRHFTLRTHERIRSILARHLDIESHDAFEMGIGGWDYHVARGRTPSH